MHVIQAPKQPLDGIKPQARPDRLEHEGRQFTRAGIAAQLGQRVVIERDRDPTHPHRAGSYSRYDPFFSALIPTNARTTPISHRQRSLAARR